MAQQERIVVADPALAVVEVGVADPAGLHIDDRLARTGIGHDHRLERYFLALAPGDHALHFVRHASHLVSEG